MNAFKTQGPNWKHSLNIGTKSIFLPIIKVTYNILCYKICQHRQDNIIYFFFLILRWNTPLVKYHYLKHNFKNIKFILVYFIGTTILRLSGKFDVIVYALVGYYFDRLWELNAYILFVYGEQKRMNFNIISFNYFLYKICKIHDYMYTKEMDKLDD